MSIDLDKVSRFPWKRVDFKGWSGFETPDGEDLVIFATCTPNISSGHLWHGRLEYKNEDDFKIVELMSLVLDIQMRHGWIVDRDIDGWFLWIPNEQPERYDNVIRAYEALVKAHDNLSGKIGKD